MPTPPFSPFADNAASLSLDGLTLENGEERVALYGQLDLTRDKAGLKLARQLKIVLDALVHYLETAHNLPERLPPPKAAETVKNPFGSG